MAVGGTGKHKRRKIKIPFHQLISLQVGFIMIVASTESIFVDSTMQVLWSIKYIKPQLKDDFFAFIILD